MRVISGEYGSRRLITLTKLETRPTLDHVKEGIFNHLGSMKDKCFLDLFCGCGSIGIEAISRQAKLVVFNDKSHRAINCLKNNLTNLEIDSNKYRVYSHSYLDTLAILSDRFDFIYLDPPFTRDYILPCLKYINDNQLLLFDGKIIVESEADEQLENDWFEIYKVANYGRIKITYMAYHH